MSWRLEAACKGADPALFYYERYTNELSISVARSICKECPVARECLDDAIRNRERHGIWGGTTPQERGAERWRNCKQCGGPFDYEPKPGQPKAYCSDRCHKAARNAQLESYAELRLKAPGLMKGKGHGKISRYMDGCRCRSCKKIARVKRAGQRAHGTDSQGTSGTMVA